MCKAFLGMGGVVEKRLVIINHENVTSPAGLELTMASHKRVKGFFSESENPLPTKNIFA